MWLEECPELSRIDPEHPKPIQIQNVQLIVMPYNAILIAHRVYIDTVNDKSEEYTKNCGVWPMQESGSSGKSCSYNWKETSDNSQEFCIFNMIYFCDFSSDYGI